MVLSLPGEHRKIERGGKNHAAGRWGLFPRTPSARWRINCRAPLATRSYDFDVNPVQSVISLTQYLTLRTCDLS